MALKPEQTELLRLAVGFHDPPLDKLDNATRGRVRNLKRRLDKYGCSVGTDLHLDKYTSDKLPSESETAKTLREMNVDEDGKPVRKPYEKSDSPGEAGTPAQTGGRGGRRTPMRAELPFLSLHSEVKVPSNITASKLMAMAALRSENLRDYKEIFEERVVRPTPAIQKKAMGPLFRDTPCITVVSRDDALSVALARFCEAQPIASIRDLAVHLNMDLTVFSSVTLAKDFPKHKIEVRLQSKFDPDVNEDDAGNPTWKYESKSDRSNKWTIERYAKYQADNFKASLAETERLEMAGYEGAAKNAKRMKMTVKKINFGTNIDFSDEEIFKAQLDELAKLPSFCRIIAGCNLLTHLGHPLYGMNTAQGYMKIPGNRTPAHMENNCLASVNLNVGPGDCEWFGVPYDYWGNISRKCGRNIDFLAGSWWPDANELISMGIPVYRFTQKAGDLVYVGPGCVHWVQSTGWCNNVAWNVAPITHTQLSMAVAQYEYNRFAKYPSLVPMQNLFWRTADKVQVKNEKVYSLVRGMLIRSLAYCKMIADWASKQTNCKKYKMRPKEEGALSNYCTACKIEVFNILFCKTVKGKKIHTIYVYCVNCARRPNFGKYHVRQQIYFDDLQKIFDKFQLQTNSTSTIVV